jgi:hypothetical protein
MIVRAPRNEDARGERRVIMAEDGGGARDVVPHGEGLRRALRWLDERVREDPGASRLKLVGEAATRFDLTPMEEDFLLGSWVRG